MKYRIIKKTFNSGREIFNVQTSKWGIFWDNEIKYHFADFVDYGFTTLKDAEEKIIMLKKNIDKEKRDKHLNNIKSYEVIDKY